MEDSKADDTRDIEILIPDDPAEAADPPDGEPKE